MKLEQLLVTMSLLLLDFVRFVTGALESTLDFLASRPVSRSKDPSLGLLDIEPGGARREMLDPGAGILDIFFLDEQLATSGLLESSC